MALDLRAQRLASSEARNVAVRRLKEAHPAEYQAFYEEEAVKRGVQPARTARIRRIARLRAELAELEKE